MVEEGAVQVLIQGGVDSATMPRVEKAIDDAFWALTKRMQMRAAKGPRR